MDTYRKLKEDIENSPFGDAMRYYFNGEETAGILTTIVKTAVANGLYPDEYIIRILKNRNEVISNPEKFLPWNPWMREGIEIKRLRSSVHRTKIGFSG